MPFVQLQHSKDMTLLDVEYNTLFKKIYSILHANLGNISTFKASVYISHYSYVIVHEKENKSFIYLRISLLKKANRTDEVKNKIGNEILKILEEFFLQKLERENVNLNPAVEIVDVHSLFKSA